MRKKSQPHYRSLIHYRKAKVFIKRNGLDKELNLLQFRGIGKSSVNMVAMLRRAFANSECKRKFQFPIILKK